MHEEAEHLSIGQLAAASGLSPKALRLYDESGLLPPRRVDPFTGYRSYRADQVERARLIAALRGVGMGLARIAVVCDLPTDAAVGEIRAWWNQERADAVSRNDAVDLILRTLGDPPKEHTMTITPRSAVAPWAAVRLERGAVRSTQQDAALSRPLPGGAHLLAVADGFGDDHVADLALETIAGVLAGRLEGSVPVSSQDLERAWAAAEEQVDGTPGGSALTVAIVDGGRLLVAHIGDTRLLIIRRGEVTPVTHDHTHVGSLVASGRLSADEAERHPDRARLNRALAAGVPTAPDLLVRRIEPDDRIVLLSDGIHAVAAPAAVADALTAPGTGPADAAEQLVHLALAAGGPDNLAVIVADLAPSGRRSAARRG